MSCVFMVVSAYGGVIVATFGELLAELRQDKGLTQKQLGRVLSVSTGTISNYENGVHYPDLEKLVFRKPRSCKMNGSSGSYTDTHSFRRTGNRHWISS